MAWHSSYHQININIILILFFWILGLVMHFLTATTYGSGILSSSPWQGNVLSTNGIQMALLT